MARWRGLSLLCAVIAMLAATALALPRAARADGDPASDTLISSNVFYPYSTSVPASAHRALTDAVSAAIREGAPLKVALIAHPTDLGSVTGYWGHPQAYAGFLHVEISLGHNVRLLVVMPSGFGTAGFPAKVARAVDHVAPANDSSSGAALAQAATRAVRALTAATGATGDRQATGDHPGQWRTVLLLALIMAALLVAGTIVLLRIFFPPPVDTPGSRGKA